ncbi:YALIA101S01e12398g1_1 [Yarrowia lipolytica]|nr:YALIA101S01e12398g1_1 [Yarrowia lipolytica]
MTRAKQLVIDSEGILRDERHRQINLRGINMASDAKMPSDPYLPTHQKSSEDFWDGDNARFIGRPFHLKDAHEHLQRIKSWGFNTIRYIYTWEAIEHEGPGKYDEDFVDFTIEVLRLCDSYGFYVIMDPHQDVWSRHTGGSGAPMWTLYAAGLNPRTMSKTWAALVHNTWEPKPSEFPKMIWATNYTRLACFVMFTLFYGGRDYAPKCIINGINIQDFLTNHFINAMVFFYKRVKARAPELWNTCIIGLESLNEPSVGLIGHPNLAILPDEQPLKLGPHPTPFQSFQLGMGMQVEVDEFEFSNFGPKKKGTRVLDPEGVRAWIDPKLDDYDDTRYGWKRDPGWVLGECVWAQHGVWDPAEKKLLRPDYFTVNTHGDVVNVKGTKNDGEDGFVNLYFKDHWALYFQTMRKEVCDKVFLLCQPPVMRIPPLIKDDKTCMDRRVLYAPHFYDGLTLMLKRWCTWNVDVLGILRGRYSHPAFALKIGPSAVRKCLAQQLQEMKKEGLDNMGPIPMVMTETGMPFDMDDKSAYSNGDYSSQLKALDANMNAVDQADINVTMWCYTVHNNHKWGDEWNGEDFAFWSRSPLSDDNPNKDRLSILQQPQHDHQDCTPFVSPAPSLCDFVGDKSETDSSPSQQTPTPKPDEAEGTDTTAHANVDGHNRLHLPHPHNPLHFFNRGKDPHEEDELPPVSQKGVRAVEAFARPYPIAIGGTLAATSYELIKRHYILEIEAAGSNQETIIAIPQFVFPTNFLSVTVSTGSWKTARNQLFWSHNQAGRQKIEITVLDHQPEFGGFLDTFYSNLAEPCCVVM